MVHGISQCVTGIFSQVKIRDSIQEYVILDNPGAEFSLMYGYNDYTDSACVKIRTGLPLPILQYFGNIN